MNENEAYEALYNMYFTATYYDKDIVISKKLAIELYEYFEQIRREKYYVSCEDCIYIDECCYADNSDGCNWGVHEDDWENRS